MHPQFKPSIGEGVSRIVTIHTKVLHSGATLLHHGMLC